MNIQAPVPDNAVAAKKSNRSPIADCDIHPVPKSVKKEIYPFLEQRWHQHLDAYGLAVKMAFSNGNSYPKSQPYGARRDAYTSDGDRPGSDLNFMRTQYLDPYNVQFGVLFPLESGPGARNADLAAAYCSAANDWQIAEWTSKEPRLKATIMVPYEDAAASVKEIERRASDKNFVQVGMFNRTGEPMGQRRYWPIYEAAAAANLPLGVHAFGHSGWPVTGGGWPSYYIEDMTGHSQSCANLITSMVLEGVFERLPGLRLIVIEAGFAWLAALQWRLDSVWEKTRDELPHVKRKPSEYIREQIWVSSQPIEEPDNRTQLADAIDWIGWDRILFASDYPHWDFDDPDFALPVQITKEQRERFFLGNALAAYGQKL